MSAPRQFWEQLPSRSRMSLWESCGGPRGPSLGQQLPLLLFAVLVAGMIVMKHRSKHLTPDEGNGTSFWREETSIQRGMRMNFRRYKTASGFCCPFWPFWFFPRLRCNVGARDSEGPERVAWQTNLPAAQDQAGKAGKLVFIDFTATWCGPCQSLKQTLWNDPEVAAAIAARFVPVRIDVDQQAGFGGQIRPRGNPCVCRFLRRMEKRKNSAKEPLAKRNS